MSTENKTNIDEQKILTEKDLEKVEGGAYVRPSVKENGKTSCCNADVNIKRTYGSGGFYMEKKLCSKCGAWLG